MLVTLLANTLPKGIGKCSVEAGALKRPYFIEGQRFWEKTLLQNLALVFFACLSRQPGCFFDGF